MENGLSVYVVSGDCVWKQSITSLLREWNYRFHDFSSGEILLQALHKEDGVCVIVNNECLNSSCLMMLHNIQEKSPCTQVIFYEQQACAETIVAALRAGAVDWFDQASPAELIRHAIERAELIIAREKRLLSLSPREKEVLSYLKRGLTNKHIANKLEISHRTVELYRSNIMEKLSVGCFAEMLVTSFHAQDLLDRDKVNSHAQGILVAEAPPPPAPVSGFSVGAKHFNKWHLS